MNPEEFVKHIAAHGINGDLTPTMHFSGDESKMYRQFCDYLIRLDTNLRDAANRVLNPAQTVTTSHRAELHEAWRSEMESWIDYNKSNL